MARKRYVSRPRNFEEEQYLRAFVGPDWLNEAYQKDPEAVISCFEAWFEKCGKIVVDEGVFDMLVFQKDNEYLNSLLHRGELIPEFEDAPDKVFERLHYWNSTNMTSPPSATPEDAIEDLPNKDDILRVKDIVSKYVIPKEQWAKGRTTNKRNPVNDTMKEQLSLPSDATRSEVIVACLQKGKLGILATYISRHVARAAELHDCLYGFYANGVIGPRT